MPLRPRFHGAAGARRPFVDREFALEAFARELRRSDPGPHVLNVTGIGGIGKSRLLHEFRRRIVEGCRNATLDLQVPALRRQEAAIAVLRSQFGKQGAQFDRYDIAYVALWQSLHPHLRLDRRQLPMIEESRILSDLLDSAAGVPVFGAAVSLLRLLDSAAGRLRRWRWLRNDETLARLDTLSNAELADAVTFLFAEDLREATTAGRPYVVFVDAYEALATGTKRVGRASLADAWLRDLVAQLDRGLTVIASREPLGWDQHDPEWAPSVRTLSLDDLPVPARLELLTAGGVTNGSQRDRISHASGGVPFYLNLALDTWERHDTSEDPEAAPDGVVVSPTQILERFLQHVDPQDVRFLELLSVARFFDYELFRAVARAFHLPGNRMVWESLTAYSFVYPVGTDGVQLHQLMIGALRERLSAPLAAEVHAVLLGVWERRIGETRTTSDREVVDVVRETVFHALHAGRLDGPSLLSYADRAAKEGGAQGLDGIIEDVAAAVTASDSDDGDGLAYAVRCLDAESAVLVGDAPRAVTLTPDAGEQLDSVVGARLAVAGAHGRRIAGATAEALRLYEAVWARPQRADLDAVRLTAGQWAADTHMAQGRFTRAVEMAEDIVRRCGPTDFEPLGDAHRLLHLVHRFSFDFPAAASHLEQAVRAYRRAGSVTGIANVAVNRAEMLAWSDPAAALAASEDAIALQQELSAGHEIGKAFTALALACVQLGETERAHRALTLACEALERVAYRSGRARAELARGFLHAREGRTALAVRSARWAIEEFERVEVYPTLTILADLLGRMMGATDGYVTAAAERARGAVEPLDSLPALEIRMRDHLGAVTDTRSAASPLSALHAAELYRQARTARASAAGFYNDNVRVDSPGGSVIVRIPIGGADVMDLRIWPEERVLDAVAPLVREVPRVLHVSAEPAFQIHEFVDGTLLHDLAPRGVAVPGNVPTDVAKLFGALATVPHDALPQAPAGWPEDGDTASFAAVLSDVTVGRWAAFRDGYASLYGALGVPADPLTPALDGWRHLTPRPFRLLHCDVHRKNIILRNGHAVFLDWELALWGDPVYDLAVHLHKMAYLADEERAFSRAWVQALPSALTKEWQSDLTRYLVHERIKSVIVDTVRYAKLVATPTTPPERRHSLVQSLTTKLNNAGAIWGRRTGVEAEAVGRILEREAH